VDANKPFQRNLSLAIRFHREHVFDSLQRSLCPKYRKMFNAISSDIKSQKDDLSSSPGSSVRIGVLGPREPLCDDSRSIDHLHQNTVRLHLWRGELNTICEQKRRCPSCH